MSAVTRLEFKDGDDGGEFESAEQIVIRTVENGYVVIVDFYDSTVEYVFSDSIELLTQIKRLL